MKKRCGLLLCLLLCALLNSAPGGVSASATVFYRGVDLSYVNEMEDCGAVYRVNGQARDPYQIFADYGANLVRLRLWHTPTWTAYSTFDDVVRSLRRANALGMDVLLDFHYSDTWADPSHQTIPAAWAEITDLNDLGQALYQYTYDVLMALDALGLMPEMVQVGNEINSAILRAENTSGYPIDWERNAFLLNRAIQAVRDADAQSAESPRVMLHIAKPEEVEGWLLAATRAGVTDFDIVGISYYPGWSDHTIATTGNVIRQLRHRFDTEVMIVETAILDLRRRERKRGQHPGSQFPVGRVSRHPRRAAPVFDRSDADGLYERRPGRSILGTGLGLHAVPHSVGTGIALGKRHLLRLQPCERTAAGNRVPAIPLRLPGRGHAELSLCRGRLPA